MGPERSTSGETTPNLEFGPYRLDRGQHLLFRESEIIPLAPKIYDTLVALVESGGRVVDKQDLLKRVWQDAFVEEGSLARSVSTLRKTLGENPRDQKYIVTVPKRGYRFAARVTAAQAASPAVSPRTPQNVAHNFVGRLLERKSLEEHLETMLAGSGKLVLLTGEAGIGKSSLP